MDVMVCVHKLPVVKIEAYKDLEPFLKAMQWSLNY